MVMNDDMQYGKRVLARGHYREIAKWFERVALLVLASLVVHKIVLGQIGDPTVYISVVVSLTLYTFAYQLLIRS